MRSSRSPLSLSLSVPHCKHKHKLEAKNILSPMMSKPTIKPKELSSERPPDGVVVDILTRLPAKSLVRFRCVSKSWNSIITKPVFNDIRLDQAKSLSYNNNNNNGYLLHMPITDNDSTSSREDLCISVWNNDRTLTQISKFEAPFSGAPIIVCFCNGLYLCVSFYNNNVLYLWNPSIRKFKKVVATYWTEWVFNTAVLGLAYDSQNNDFKILRIVQQAGTEVAEVYTLSTDSWRKVVVSVESLSGSIGYIESSSPCLFFNGALHSIAWSGGRHFILAFDVNDEIFREIMLPQINFDEISQTFEWLAVLKGSLALIVCSEADDHGHLGRDTFHILVMREYGVVESWTTRIVPLDFTEVFFGCTDSGELLIQVFENALASFDPETLNENLLGVNCPHWLSYTGYLMESLVLLDQHNEAEMEPDSPLCPSEATNTSSDSCFIRAKYPSLPSREVQVTNDVGEGETMIVPRSNYVPYDHAWMGGPFEAEFVECYSLIGSMKNWIWSSSQSSFARQNKLSHEIDLLHNRVESQANTIRTLERCLWSFGPREAGGSSDPWIRSSSQSSVACQNNLSHEIDLLRNKIESQASTIRTLERCLWSFGPRKAGGSSDLVSDAADGVTPSPGDEGNPMNTTLQSKEGSSRHMKHLAPKHPSRCQVCEGTTLATIRSKSGDLPSGEQITRDDEEEEDKEDTTPLVQRQSKRGRL